MLTHFEQNKVDMATYQAGDLDTQVNGMGHDDASLQVLGNTIDRVLGGQSIVDDDASSWDLSVTRDSVMLDNERRAWCAGIEDSPTDLYKQAFVEMLYCEAAANTAHVLAIGTGLHESQRFGITASGIPSTAGQNSPIRYMLCRLGGALAALTMGDDLMYSGNKKTSERVSAFQEACGVRNKGCTVREPGEILDFTSHHLYSVEVDEADGKKRKVWKADFQNNGKMLARMCFSYSEGPLEEVETPDGVQLKPKPNPYGKKDRLPEKQTLDALAYVNRTQPAIVEVMRVFCQRKGWLSPDEQLDVDNPCGVDSLSRS
jgi:hypothetical protein